MCSLAAFIEENIRSTCGMWRRCSHQLFLLLTKIYLVVSSVLLDGFTFNGNENGRKLNNYRLVVETGGRVAMSALPMTRCILMFTDEFSSGFSLYSPCGMEYDCSEWYQCVKNNDSNSFRPPYAKQKESQNTSPGMYSVCYLCEIQSIKHVHHQLFIKSTHWKKLAVCGWTEIETGYNALVHKCIQCGAVPFVTFSTLYLFY